MITQCAANYATVLHSLKIAENIVMQSKEILLEHPQLINALENPSVRKEEKEAVVDAIFPVGIRNFLKIVCFYNHIDICKEIFEAYEMLLLKEENKIRAKLLYVIDFEEEELDQIKEMICNKYRKTGVVLELERDPSLIAGFVLTIDGVEYDKSIKGTLDELKQTLVGR